MSTAPVVASVSYSPATANPGDLVTVTVTGTAGSQLAVRNVTGTATFTDQASGLQGSLSGLLTITSPVEDVTTAAFTDTDGREWSPLSLAQTPAGVVTAKFTATA
jgi:hypothetical protein